MKIQFKKIKPGAKLPTRNGAMYDLYIPQNVTYERYSPWRIIELGFACKLPEGYHACVYMRSSTFKNYGLILTNHVGIIDNAYCGDNDEWKLSVYFCHDFMQKPTGTNCGYMIPAGTRIAQFEIVKDCPELEFEEVETLGNANRGGFGSTGK